MQQIRDNSNAEEPGIDINKTAEGRKRHWNVSVPFGNQSLAVDYANHRRLDLTAISSEIRRGFILAETHKGGIAFDAIYGAVEINGDESAHMLDGFRDETGEKQTLYIDHVETCLLRLTASVYTHNPVSFTDFAARVSGVLGKLGHLRSIIEVVEAARIPPKDNCSIEFSRVGGKKTKQEWLEEVSRNVRKGTVKDFKDLKNFMPEGVRLEYAKAFRDAITAIQEERKEYLREAMHTYEKTRILICPLFSDDSSEIDDKGTVSISGIGKSELATFLACQLDNSCATPYHKINATRDILSQTKGESTLIVDEYTGAAIAPSSLLALLEPKADTFQDSRNVNRCNSSPLTIICAKKKVTTLANNLRNLFGRTNEGDLKQIFRRLDYILVIDNKTGWIYMFQGNNAYSQASKFTQISCAETKGNFNDVEFETFAHVVQVLQAHYGGSFIKEEMTGCGAEYDYFKTWEMHKKSHSNLLQTNTQKILSRASHCVQFANERTAQMGISDYDDKELTETKS